MSRVLPQQLMSAFLIAPLCLATAVLSFVPATADEVENLISEASLDEYQGYLRVLTGVEPVPGNPPHYVSDRYSFGDDIHIVGQWIFDMFESFGLDASLHTFDASYGLNVIGELPGTTSPEDIYIICAHYDTVSGTPGCDDNGSGTAAVIMAARILSQVEFEGTIRFITFAGEEQWMVGSQAYVADAYAAGDNIVAAINIDMVLHPSFDDQEPDPDYDLDIGGNHASQWIGEFLAAQYALYTSLDTQLHDDSGYVSDQWSFWPYGYDAVGLAENTPWEIWGGSIDCYHQPCDVISNRHFDWDFGLEAVRGGMAGLINLAGLVSCPGDIDGDGDVDLADLALLLAAYDTCAGDPYYDATADLDGSGCVDLADLAILLGAYGYGT